MSRVRSLAVFINYLRLNYPRLTLDLYTPIFIALLTAIFIIWLYNDYLLGTGSIAYN